MVNLGVRTTAAGSIRLFPVTSLGGQPAPRLTNNIPSSAIHFPVMTAPDDTPSFYESTTPGVMLVATGHLEIGKTSPYARLQGASEVVRSFRDVEHQGAGQRPETLLDRLRAEAFLIQDHAALMILATQYTGTVVAGVNAFGTHESAEFDLNLPDLDKVIRSAAPPRPMEISFDGIHFLASTWVTVEPNTSQAFIRHPQHLDDALIASLGLELSISWHMVYNWHAVQGSVSMFPGQVFRLAEDLNVPVVNARRIRPTQAAQWVGQDAGTYVLRFLKEREATRFRAERVLALLEGTYGLTLDLTSVRSAVITPPDSLEAQRKALAQLQAAWKAAQPRLDDYTVQGEVMALARAFQAALRGLLEFGTFRRFDNPAGIIYGPYTSSLYHSATGTWQLHNEEHREDVELRFATLESRLSRAKAEQDAFQRDFNIHTDAQSVGTSLVSSYTSAETLAVSSQAAVNSDRVSNTARNIALAGLIAAFGSLVAGLIPLLRHDTSTPSRLNTLSDTKTPSQSSKVGPVSHSSKAEPVIIAAPVPQLNVKEERVP